MSVSNQILVRGYGTMKCFPTASSSPHTSRAIFNCGYWRVSSSAARRPGLLLVQEVTIADDAKSYAYREREYVSYVFEVRGMR